MTNELVSYQQALHLDTFSQIEKLGEWMGTSGMCGVKTIQQGKIVALSCVLMGINPIEFEKSYHVIGGKVVKKSMAALVEFRKAGGKFLWIRTGDETKFDPENPDDCYAEIELEFEGIKLKYRYSMAMAVAEGLVKSGSRYSTIPGNMLRARCCSNGIPLVCPEIYAGIDIDDNLEMSREISSRVAVSAPPAVQSASEKPKAVDVVVEEVVDQTECKPAEPLQKAPEPKPESKLIGPLAPDELIMLESALGDDAGLAIKWMTATGKIQTSVAETPRETYVKIMKDPEKFKKFIHAWDKSKSANAKKV
jgi:hypothetical protein